MDLGASVMQSADELLKKGLLKLKPAGYDDESDDEFELGSDEEVDEVVEMVRTRLLIDNGFIKTDIPYKFDLQQPDLSSMEKILKPSEYFKKRIIRPGRGIFPVHGARVYYYYVGFIVDFDSGRPFDVSHQLTLTHSSLARTSECLFGLKKALETMRMGEVAHILIQPEYAFGKLGCPEGLYIPKDAQIIYTVHMVDFIRPDEARMSTFRRGKNIGMPFDDVMCSVNQLNQEGNEFFKQRKFKLSTARYKAALDLMESKRTANEQEHFERLKILSMVHVNIGSSYVLLERYEKAKEEILKALEEPEYCLQKSKAYLRLAEANLGLHDYNAATDACTSGIKYLLVDQDQRSGRLQQDLTQLQMRIMSSKQKTEFEEKAMCRRMFGGGNPKVIRPQATNTHRKPLPKSVSTVTDKYRKSITSCQVPQQLSSDINNNVNTMAVLAGRRQPAKKLQMLEVQLSPVQSKKFTTRSTGSYQKINASSDNLKNWNIEGERQQG